MATINQFNFYLFCTARGKELSDKLFFPNLISHIIKELIFYLNIFLPLRKFPISCRREYNNKISLLRFLRSKFIDILRLYDISIFWSVMKIIQFKNHFNLLNSGIYYSWFDFFSNMVYFPVSKTLQHIKQFSRKRIHQLLFLVAITCAFILWQ